MPSARPGRLIPRVAQLSLAVAVLLAACGGERASPSAPRLVPSADVLTRPLIVQVMPRTQFATVWAINPLTGPFQNGQPVAAKTDVEGSAFFQALARDRKYCVLVRSLGEGEIGFMGRPVVPPPPGGGPVDSNQAFASVMTGPNGSTLPLTRSNFLTYCTTSLAPITLTPELVVPLALNLTTPLELKWRMLDLNGAVHNVAAWTMVETPIPWFPAGQVAAGVRPALLLATNPDGVGQAIGLSTTDSVVVQSALRYNFPQGLLTATLRGRPAPAGSAAPITAYLEPVVCVLDGSALERFGDVTGGPDLGGFGPDNGRVYKGWGADPSLDLDAGTFSIWHELRGTGTVTLNVRFLGGPIADLSQDFAWNGSTWTKGATRGAGQQAITVRPFAAPLGNGTFRITWLVQGVDPAVTAVDVQLRAGNDQWPEPGRVAPVPGFYRLNKPTGGCSGSNVQRFWID